MPVSFRRAGLAASILALAASLILTLPIRPGGAVSAPAEDGHGIDPAWQFCRDEIAAVEQAERIPAHLLAAIAVVESGRQAPAQGEARGEISAWPWTVMAEGKGRYLPSKEAAIAEVEGLRARGVRNIDVGCMQVNLKYHPEAFADLEEAFDPAANVAYAAAFLKALRNDKGSWAKAVAHYHSATPERYIRYRTKVFAAWRDERRRAVKVDYAADLARAESTVAETQVADAAPLVAPPTPSVPAPVTAEIPAPAEEPTLLAALAFGRAGPVEPETEAAALPAADAGVQLGLVPAPQGVTVASLLPGG
jgi:hypothetical protein